MSHLHHRDGVRVLDPLPVTHWSLVSRAGRDDVEGRRSAPAELLGHYLAPMRSRLTARRRSAAARADALVRGSVATQVRDSDLPAGAAGGRGRSRPYLLPARARYVFNQARHDRAKKRSADGGAATPIDA